MARLTEEMVIARSKQSDLAAIKKLNCWGSELSDVSIIRRMRGVEVLAFSVNRISTLADFENCINLQELYLRKNNLTDIDELVYLQNLPKLKFLWLEENPLVELAGPGYRQIVLRALPNLKKLDNVDVSPEEVAEAMRAPVAQPQQRHEVYENPSPPPPVQHQQTSPQQQQQQYRQQSPVIEEYYQSDYQRQNPPAHYRHSQMDLTEWDESSSAAHHQNNNNNGGQNSSNSHHQQQQQQQQQQQHHGQSNYQQNRRSIAGSTVNERELYQYRNGNGKGPESRDEWEDVDRRRNENRRSDSRFNDSASVISNALLNHFAGVHRRPVSRNSNLLSATLCLVKELDYPSLEVVEHAVRCRIDELAE
ncbi:zinc finger protein rotund isoform X7 [Anopheles gambiae]|uniref:zinc finger protein rotund isoform X7 n=1 Tax=Anopheles gambiae TaxID=7165 RepID=UPI002AC9E860|nr:zinc finger protein rotund isoform X7 [Anopheles gambiae]XP_061502499.1 zinc finger protein rotund isoform X7 [Anopheles gambiae]XP_061502500.1 zinc finger protein rotund isoform X7 [Anopheles gambiae]